jgi:surface antigen
MLTKARDAIVYGTFITVVLAATTSSANAHTKHSHHAHTAGHASRHHGFTRVAYYRHAHRFYGAHVIQCVAFAKADAGIEIRGNARDWWDRAAGIYERGDRPETGSVLSFRQTGRMPLGHVAVVSATVDSRTIIIDQSHWNSNGITRDVEVKDVSEDNDWSLVRVQLKHGGEFGSIYPTHGFIYPRPDTGRDEPAAVRRVTFTEVAEAPGSSRPLDLSVGGIATDAPYRAFR